MRMQVNKHRMPLLNAVHAAANQLPLVGGKLLKNLLPFRLPQPLHNNLPRRLRRNPAGVMRHLFRLRNLIANLNIGTDFQRVRQRNLRVRKLHLRHHRPQRKNADLARIGVQLHRQVLPPRRVIPAKGRRQRNFNRPQHLVLRQSPFRG